jgi:hypothetical protein
MRDCGAAQESPHLESAPLRSGLQRRESDRHNKSLCFPELSSLSTDRSLLAPILPCYTNRSNDPRNE